MIENISIMLILLIKNCKFMKKLAKVQKTAAYSAGFGSTTDGTSGMVKLTKKHVFSTIGLMLCLLAGGLAVIAPVQINQAQAAILVPQPKPPSALVKVAYTPAGDKSVVSEEASAKSPSILKRMVNRITASRRLSEVDAARYAHIFAFQDIGDFGQAKAEIKKLDDKRLMGHVLYQRYMHPEYKSNYAELAAWVKEYADHPGAQAVYDLAQRRKPQGAANLSAPRTTKGVLAQHDFDVGKVSAPLPELAKHTPRARDIIRAVDGNLADSPTSAFRRINTAEAQKIFTPVQYDSLRTDIASSYFYNDKADKAFELASASAKRSGAELPMAGWIAGLSAWKMGKYADAARYFEISASSHRASPWMASGSAYWAARAHLRNHQPQKVSKLLEQAAEYPRTFYGIIALKALGFEKIEFNWETPALTEKHLRALSAIPAGRRAIALVDAEQSGRAEAELAQINPGNDLLLQEALIAISSQKGMPHLAMRLGSSFKGKSGRLYDAALYPDAPWIPEKGLEVDRALIYAFIRQESNFDTDARNRSSGAQGLMQLMPMTAKHVASKTGDQTDQDKLRDPTVNIDLGQKYLSDLLQNNKIENDLFRLAVAYNAGPGKMARWSQTVDYKDDPLLFIESIPAAETRIFVERVLANYWIYRIKFRQPTSSLDDVAEGNWPDYVAQDKSITRSLASAAMLFSK
jgi:soluble lytic murein transglycosylase